MPNILVLDMRANLIVDGYQHLTSEALAIIKEKYAQLGRSKNLNYRVMLVCDVIFHKWLRLESKYSGMDWPVTIKQLMRASVAFRSAITCITPQKGHRGVAGSKSAVGNPTPC